MKRLFVLTALVVLSPSQESGGVDDVDFVRDVRPIFMQRCYACHGAENQKSGLRLDIKSEAFKGGDGYGPSVVSGEPGESPLLELVSTDDEDLRMPPEGESLSTAQIATLTKWIEQGAVWPDGVDLAQLEDRMDHWSFKPVTHPEVPPVRDSTWPRSEVDYFILARLEREGIFPAPQAEPSAWLRRVTLDLTGLPPTPQELTNFLQAVRGSDEKNSAYETVVARLLNSPRYGERWAQHWLDVVRYADTHGFEVNTERPHAWPYRDYVIDSFNDDLPYDQFIREQIVGDAIEQDAATGFLVTASVLLPGQIGRDEPSKRLARQDSLDEIVVNLGQTFLGLSVACARCHDHKFDPISQRDYYAMQAFVAGVEYGDREMHTPEAEARRLEAQKYKQELAQVEQQLARFAPRANSGAERPSVNAQRNTDRFDPVKATQVRLIISATNNLEPCIDELEVFDTNGRNIALASTDVTVTSTGDTTVANRHELQFINDGRYGNSRSWMSNENGKGSVTLRFSEAKDIERVVWGRDREGKFTDRLATEYRIEVADAAGSWEVVADSSDRAKFVANSTGNIVFSTQGLSPEEADAAEVLHQRKQSLETSIAQAETGLQVFGGKFRDPDDIHLLSRGDPEQPRDRVAPAVLSEFGSLSLPADAPEQQRRQVLAEWIANSENRLTARVMVNRIWQGHFGVGLVETASDFGRMGTKPSHPKLLDWLAQEFVRSGWSIKHMHRLLVLSATYRQSTQHNTEAAERDGGVRLLWRYPSRRMDAETIRDSMLAVSGRLDCKMGGPGFDLFNKRGGLSGFDPVESFQGEGLRRMIYAHKVRRERDAVFGAFDCPDGGQSTARRIESTTPIQALNLLNSHFTLEQSEAFAKRLQAEVGDVIEHQIRAAYQLAFCREPSAAEVADCEAVVREHGLASLCRVLFNSNEFLFLP